MSKMRVVLLLVGLALLVAVTSGASFFYGKQAESRVDNVSMVCVYRNTEIRESPTGYIIVRIVSGTRVWVNKIEPPFAYVSYFDGQTWIEGSITAGYLGMCGDVVPSVGG